MSVSDYKDGLRLLPEHMRGAVTRYIDGGLPHMGGFLRAVMENNLSEAFGRADDINTAAMKNWVVFVHSYAPCGCHGSPERVKDWIERGGLVGKGPPEDEITKLAGEW